MTAIKVTITASLEAVPNTVNFYGGHNLNKELITTLTEFNISYVTLHIFSKDEAMRAIEFCAKNNLEYRLGGNN